MRQKSVRLTAGRPRHVVASAEIISRTAQNVSGTVAGPYGCYVDHEGAGFMGLSGPYNKACSKACWGEENGLTTVTPAHVKPS